MADSPLFDMQAPRGLPLSSDVETISDPLVPQQATSGMLGHFFDAIYDLRPESHLSRLLSVLLGDAGVGRVRKQATYTHLVRMLQTAHFYDMDRLFADVFGFRRFMSEALDYDPMVEPGTFAEWEAVLAADASYRNRIQQFVRGIAWGPTPYGMQQVASAVIGYPVRIYESYENIDAGVFYDPFVPASQLTYGELEDYTYGQIEGFTYGQAEGSADSPTGSVYEIGPGSTNSSTPTDMDGPAMSSTEIDPVLSLFGQTLYYTTTTDVDGNVVIDTTPSTTSPLLWSFDRISVEVTSGQFTITSTVNNRDTVIVAAVAGVPVRFTVRLSGTIVLGSPNRYIRVLVTGLYNVNPWNPYAPPAIKPSRTNFTVRPLRAIDPEEKYHLIRVLDRLKPVNSRALIETVPVSVIDDVEIAAVYSPSVFWAIRSEVIPRTGTESAYTRVGEEGEPVEQPFPAFAEYQGEEWFYNDDVLSVTAYAEDETGVFQTSNYERIVHPDTGKIIDFLSTRATLSQIDILRGRAVRDGVLTVPPTERVS